MKNVILIGAILLLTGCSIFQKEPEKIYVTETKFVTPEVPKSLTDPCVADRPFKSDQYLKLTPVEREQYLTDYSIGLLGVINVCNKKLSGINKILTEAKK